MKKKCYLCSGENFSVIHLGTRDDPDINVLRCNGCTLVFLDKNTIFDDYYANSKMHGNSIPTIDEWLIETLKDDERRISQFNDLIKGKVILDFGCGAGGFLRKTVGLSKLSCGIEVEARVHEAYKSSEIKIFNDISRVDIKFDYIFAFHVFEHLADPVDILRKLKNILKPGGKVIVEVPHSEDALLTLYKNIYFAQHTFWSNHLFLFNAHTLEKLARTAEMRTISIQGFQRYPLSNHLYWLSNGRAGGHVHWNFLNIPDLEQAYANALGAVNKNDTIIGYFESDEKKL